MRVDSRLDGLWAVVVCLCLGGPLGCAVPSSLPSPLLRVYRTVGDTGRVETLNSVNGSARSRPAETLVVLIPHDAVRPSLPGTPALPTTELNEGEPLSLAEVLATKTAIFRRTGLTDPQLRIVVMDWAGPPADTATARVRVLDTAAMLMRLLVVGGHLQPADRQHLHVIGHGRGGAVASLLARRLAEQGRPVEHLTLLDAYDAVSSHQAFQESDEPPLAPERAGWSDNYFGDGYFAGVASGDNFFASGRPIRGARINVRFNGLVGLGTLDQYRRSVADPSYRWGWNWSRLGGDWRPERGSPATLEIDAPRVVLEGSISSLEHVEHELLFAPPGQPETVLRQARYHPSGPAAKILRPGRYLLRARDRTTGRPLPLEHTVITHRFDAGPASDTRRVVPPSHERADLGHLFEVPEGTVGIEHLFRLAPREPPP